MKKAIFVLESPWDMDDADANRSSVLPFIQGIAKFAGDTEVFHANFYDKNSFDFALNCVCKTKFDNTVVYIAAHGIRKKIGNCKILDLLVKIGLVSKKYNISGVMLGSCFVGSETTTMEACLEGTNIKWCAGYASSCDWLTGTMIDSAILSRMSHLEQSEFSSKDQMIEQFAEALAPFSSEFEIGEDHEENPVELKNSMKFVVQPTGSGMRASEVSTDLIFQ